MLVFGLDPLTAAMLAAWWKHGWLRTLDSYHFHMLACHHVSMVSLPAVCQRIVIEFLRPLLLLVVSQSLQDDWRILYSIRLLLPDSLECVGEVPLHGPDDRTSSTFCFCIFGAVRVPLSHNLACTWSATSNRSNLQRRSYVSLSAMTSGHQLWSKRLPTTSHSIACVSSQGLLVVGVVGRLYLLDVACGSALMTILLSDIGHGITCIVSAHLIDSTAEVLLVGCHNELCVVPTSGACVCCGPRLALGPFSSVRITTLVCAPSGSSIAAGLQNGYLCIVDSRTLAVLHNIEFGNMALHGVTFLSETQVAVGYAMDLHIVDVGSGARLRCLAIDDAHLPMAVARSPHGEFLFVACLEAEDQDTGGIYKAGFAGFGETSPIVMRVNDTLVADIFEYA